MGTIEEKEVSFGFGFFEVRLRFVLGFECFLVLVINFVLVLVVVCGF